MPTHPPGNCLPSWEIKGPKKMMMLHQPPLKKTRPVYFLKKKKNPPGSCLFFDRPQPFPNPSFVAPKPKPSFLPPKVRKWVPPNRSHQDHSTWQAEACNHDLPDERPEVKAARQPVYVTDKSRSRRMEKRVAFFWARSGVWCVYK